MATATQSDQPGFLNVDLTGRRVLITAGAAGIGRTIAEAFLDRGARVHVCDIDEAGLDDARSFAASSGLPLTVSRADVSDPRAVDALFAAALDALGGLDVLVNNAGIAGPTAAIENVEPEPLRATLAVDVESMFHCSRRAVPLLRAAGGGSIINMSSVAGRLSYAMRTPYAAAKWGVVGFSRSLALELGPDRIRVNAILPGHVNTTRFKAVYTRRAEAAGVTPEVMRDAVLERVAMRSTVEKSDIANMALYLASPYGAVITGQAISVCAGVEMMF
jgi:NAD(P)-dependent dehydrogenase (short-subunit alcohol dehydrogenase family)